MLDVSRLWRSHRQSPRSSFPTYQPLPRLFLAIQSKSGGAVYAPAKTPKAVVDYLNSQITEITNSARMIELFAGEASEPSKMNAQQFREFVDSELTKWSTLAKERNITLN